MINAEMSFTQKPYVEHVNVGCELEWQSVAVALVGKWISSVQMPLSWLVFSFCHQLSALVKWSLDGAACRA